MKLKSVDEVAATLSFAVSVMSAYGFKVARSGKPGSDIDQDALVTSCLLLGLKETEENKSTDPVVRLARTLRNNVEMGHPASHGNGGRIDAPLMRWYCDVCGDPIEEIEKGYLIWNRNESGQLQDFKIIHQSRCDDRKYPYSGALSGYLGVDGQAKLLSFLSYGTIKLSLGSKMVQPSVADMDEFVDLFRRLQTPHYEEARRHFHKNEVLESYSDANEVLPYLQSSLKKIVG